MTNGYLTRSTMTAGALDLQTALGRTPAGLVEHPELFRGFPARPDVAAAALLAVADVAATRYADFGLAKRLANLDPVVTASGDRLRFESFSACNGVHARFDLLPDGIDSGSAAFGTTNVDINPPLRTALTKVDRTALLHLAVGDDELRVSTPDTTFVEREVDLPDRWVRGFAETPLLARATRLAAELAGPAIARFFASLPRGAPPGPDLHLAPARGTLRPLLAATPGSVRLAGAARLRGAARVVPFATRLRVYAGGGVSGWVFDLPGARLTLLVSPGAYRGFSGEGSLLELLARPDARSVGERCVDELAWQPTIDVPSLASSLRVPPAAVDAGLGWLAAAGRVGYDLAEGTWFHRDLPIDADQIVKRNPRLRGAIALVEAKKISRYDDHWRAASSDGGWYRVEEDDGRLRCQCLWYHEHAGSRGPCKHVLAVMIVNGTLDPDAGSTPASIGR